MSEYGVISGPYFPVFGPEITPYLDTSGYASCQNYHIEESSSFLCIVYTKIMKVYAKRKRKFTFKNRFCPYMEECRPMQTLILAYFMQCY